MFAFSEKSVILIVDTKEGVTDMYKKIDEYIKHLSRNKSPHTTKNYQIHITKFVDWTYNKKKAKEPFELDKEVYLDYIDFMKEKYKPKSIHVHMTAIYSWLVFMHRKGYISKLPFVDFAEISDYLPPIQRERIKALTKQEVGAILEEAKKNSFEEALIRVFVDTGMRVSEIVKIDMNDIQPLKNGMYSIEVFGKGKGGMSKQRFVFISRETYDSIQRMKMDDISGSSAVFVSQWTKRPYSTKRIMEIIDDISTRAGVGHINTHIFRKTLGTTLIENGMEVEYVSKLLGHASITTTIDNYVDRERSLSDKFNQFHNMY